MTELAELFVVSILISLASFGAGAQALYYEYAVLQNRWLSDTDLSAVLAFGYATPGPAVFATSTFIGYHLGGVGGAIIGTAGAFLVPFIGALIAVRYVAPWLQNRQVQSFVGGVGLAATGLLAATALGILNSNQAELWQFALAGLAFFVSVRWHVSPLIILVVGLLTGIVMS